MGPPFYCKSCCSSVDNATGATCMHPTIEFWFCAKCFEKMTPHERADIRLRLMELAQAKAIEDLARTRQDLDDEADSWKRNSD